MGLAENFDQRCNLLSNFTGRFLTPITRNSIIIIPRSNSIILKTQVRISFEIFTDYCILLIITIIVFLLRPALQPCQVSFAMTYKCFCFNLSPLMFSHWFIRFWRASYFRKLFQRLIVAFIMFIWA